MPPQSGSFWLPKKLLMKTRGEGTSLPQEKKPAKIPDNPISTHGSEWWGSAKVFPEQQVCCMGKGKDVALRSFPTVKIAVD